jgi:hypothetical protein
MNAHSIMALSRAVQERRAILFVGAGVSISVGLPSWEMLIRQMTEELGLDAASLQRDGFQTLAEYYRLQHGSIGPLRSWMDRNCRSRGRKWSSPNCIG